MQDYASGGSKWVLDSGATNHMTGGKDLFKELRPNYNPKTLKTIDGHKVNHIITPNQLLVECESSIPSPHDMGKSALTKV